MTAKPKPFDPAGKPSDRPLWIMAGILALIWAGYYVWSMRGGNSGGSLSAAAYKWKLVDLDGKPATLADFKGKPVVLNMWATWCGPCVKEMPGLDKLAANADLKQRGVVVIGVETGGADAAAIREFAKQGKLGAIQFYRAEDMPPPELLSQYIPATYFISPGGRIVSSEVGGREWDTPEMVGRLEKLAE